MADQKYCSDCGAPNPPNATFCALCGTALVRPGSPPPMVSPPSPSMPQSPYVPSPKPKSRRFTRRQMIYVVCALVGLLIVASGVSEVYLGLNAGQSPSVLQSSVDYAAYGNSSAGVSMMYPSGWKVIEGGSNSTVVTFENGTNASVLVSSFNVTSSNESLDQFRNVMISQLNNSSLTGGFTYTLVSSQNTTLAGLPAYSLTVTATALNEPKLAQVSMMTEQDYQVYMLTFTSTSAQYSDYQNIFITMANSFGITS